jgi:uncharacterized repeat protein (TIGR01451 family)
LAQLVNLLNPGGSTVSLSINSLITSGPFTVTTGNGYCDPAMMVGPGASCNISVSFAPNASTPSGIVNGTLTIADNSVSSPHLIALSALYYLDVDNDGIPDAWEQQGVCVVLPPSGSSALPAYSTGACPNISLPTGYTQKFVNLPAMGAQVGTPDIFVQINWMGTSPDGSHDHMSNQTAIQDVIQTFKNHKINLHVDCGPSCINDIVTGQPWRNLSSAQMLPHQPTLGDAVNSAFTILSQAGLGLPPERVGIFRYAAFAHNLYQSQASGIALGYQFIVSLGSWTNQVGTVAEQEGTFMHELGHLLGLQHGGGDANNNKPNYLSVMNYHFQTRGLVFTLDSSSSSSVPMDGLFDYSGMQLGTLNESNLSDTAVPGLPGLTDPYGSRGDPFYYPYSGHFGTRYYCFNVQGNLLDETAADALSNSITWDCGSGTSPSYIDGDNSGSKILYGFDDWGNISFTQGAIGQLGAPVPPAPSPVQEITVVQDSVIRTFYGVSVLGPGNAGLPLGTSKTLIFTVLNKGTVADTYALAAAASQPWANLTGVPSQVTLAPGASSVISIPVNVPAAGAAGTVNSVTVQATSLGNSRILDNARSDIAAGQADLQIAMSASNVILGTNLAYQITVTNNGPDPALNVALNDMIPMGASQVSVTPGGTACLGTQPLSCALGNLPSGASIQMSLIIAPTVVGTIANTASVTSSLSDPTLLNNSATVSSLVVGRPSISARATVQSMVGTTVTLALQLTNTGTGSAQNLALSQITPRTLSGSGTVVFIGPNLPLALGALSVGASQTVSLMFTVPASVTRFSLSESGSVADTIGDIYSLTLAQAVVP